MKYDNRLTKKINLDTYEVKHHENMFKNPESFLFWAMLMTIILFIILMVM